MEDLLPGVHRCGGLVCAADLRGDQARTLRGHPRPDVRPRNREYRYAAGCFAAHPYAANSTSFKKDARGSTHYAKPVSKRSSAKRPLIGWVDRTVQAKISEHGFGHRYKEGKGPGSVSDHFFAGLRPEWMWHIGVDIGLDVTLVWNKRISKSGKRTMGKFFSGKGFDVFSSVFSG